MIQSDLKPEQFQAYPPEARALATGHLPLLHQLPSTLVALLLREVVNYDWKFPAEREDLDRQLVYLGALSMAQRQEAMAGFAQIHLSSDLEHFDWVGDPVEYSERLTAYLWASHQIDVFRAAALEYGRRVDAMRTPEHPAVSPLGIVIVGQGVKTTPKPLCRKLRKQGAYFSAIQPDNGFKVLLDAVAARAAKYPVRYGHWYIDGGASASNSEPGLVSISYSSLAPARAAILKRMEKVIRSGAGGPELLHEQMAKLQPEDMGLGGAGSDPILDHFQASLLSEGSGTQLFSTSFVQWAAREALRRAQPVTLLARFSPRQRQRPMSELIASPQQEPTLDPQGSLVDADMGAYLTWLNQQRLPFADQSSFLVWWEDQREAVAIGPGMPRGTESSSPLRLSELLIQIT